MNELYRPTEIMSPGQMSCPGCGLALGMRQVMRAMGNRCVVVVVPSCVAVTTGPYPNYTLGVPAFHSAFEIAAPTAAGIRNALIQQGKEDIPVLAFAGTAARSTSGCSPFPAVPTGTKISFMCAWTMKPT